MGWDFNSQWKTKTQAKYGIKAMLGQNLIASRSSGSEFWTVQGDKPTIVLYLLKVHKREWGYKDISEVEGPRYYNVPPEFLELAQETNKEWREAVKAHRLLLRQVSRLRPNDLAHYKGHVYTVIKVEKNWVYTTFQGRFYRISKKDVEGVTFQGDLPSLQGPRAP